MKNSWGIIRTISAQIHALIASLIPNPSDVQDVLHETTLLLWRDFARFDPQRNFLKWACGVAFNVVRSYRRKRRDLVLPLDDDLMALLIKERQSFSDTLEDRRQALSDCLTKLRTADRQLVVSLLCRRRHDPHGGRANGTAGGSSLPVVGPHPAGVNGLHPAKS